MRNNNQYLNELSKGELIEALNLASELNNELAVKIGYLESNTALMDIQINKLTSKVQQLEYALALCESNNNKPKTDKDDKVNKNKSKKLKRIKSLNKALSICNSNKTAISKEELKKNKSDKLDEIRKIKSLPIDNRQ